MAISFLSLGLALGPGAAGGQVDPARFQLRVAGIFSHCPLQPLPYPESCAYDSQGQDYQISLAAQNSGGSIPMADAQGSASGAVYLNDRSALSSVDYTIVLRSSMRAPTGQLVPILARLRGDATASATPPCTSAAEASSRVGSVQRTARALSTAANHSEFDEEVMLHVLPDAPFTARVSADVAVTSFAGCGADGQAVADPELRVDPTFPGAENFYFEYSRNLDAIFIDGLESGTTELWSAVSP
jgi:hypothetical protein